MKKWKATMPKELPPTGFAHVVFAYVNDEGIRSEFTGTIPKGWAEHHMQAIIIDSRKKTNDIAE